MPRGDGTGPMGMGPMSGRGAGFCAGSGVPGFINSTQGYGIGYGRGRGFRRNSYYTGMLGRDRYNYSAYGGVREPVVDEKEFLGNQVEILEKQLQQVRKRLREFNDET